MSPLVVSHRRRTRTYQDPIKVLLAVTMLLVIAAVLILFANGISIA